LRTRERRWHQSHPEYLKDYYQKREQRVRDTQLRTRYGISSKQKMEMYRKQSGLCAICGSDLISWQKAHVDHDHKRNKTRELLCRRCNPLLHAFENDAYFEAAISYLLKHLLS
jgi:hypothetical protein